jgi:HlyD family secretion protein
MELTRNTGADRSITEHLEMDAGAATRKRRRRLVGIIALAAAVVVIAVAVMTRGGGDGLTYKTTKAERGNLTVIVTATGTLQPLNEVAVGCELSGTVKAVHADYNDHVTAGEALATLDVSKLQAQVTQSRATLESAKAKVLQSQATVTETTAKLAQLTKVFELSGGKTPSQVDLDAAAASCERAKADLASARASVSQAQAALDTYLTDLSKMVVRSPIDGVVLTRAIEPGQTVAASFTAPTLFTLAEDLTKMELHVNVDEADIGTVQAGQQATFTVAAYPGRSFHAMITQARFASSTTSGVVTYETILTVDNADLALRPGMTATADIVVRHVESALLVPNTALRFTPPAASAAPSNSGGLVGSLMPHPPSSASAKTTHNGNGKEQRVWVLDAKGALRAIPVVTGSTDGTRTEVTAGALAAGADVVTESIQAEK